DVRLWPGFMKRNVSSSVAGAMEDELARQLALHSPQSADPGVGERFVANPTMQIVKTTVLRAYFRVGNELRKRDLGWQEAAVLDELAENPLETGASMSARLEGEHVNSSLNATRTFSDILLELEKIGLVLRR
ncbi:MAG: hypothetical protein AAB250_04180, partial [Bdellovibrionota bacterium]